MVSELLFTGCTTLRSGNIQNDVLAFDAEYVEMAYGVSRAYKVFGIDVGGHPNLFLLAKKDLIQNRELRASENYVNLTCEIATTNYLVFSVTKVLVSAEIVAAKKNAWQREYSENYRHDFWLDSGLVKAEER